MRKTGGFKSGISVRTVKTKKNWNFIVERCWYSWVIVFYFYYGHKLWDRARAMRTTMRHARYVGPASTASCEQGAVLSLRVVRPGAWFGSVWGGILGGIARAGFSHRESTLPDPLN